MSVRELQDYTFVAKYARWIPEKKRRETWNEAVSRVKQMMLDRYSNDPKVHDDIEWAYDMMRKKRVLGSQRALQFGGKPIFKHNARIYNCITSFCDRLRFFQECMYLLLCGCGTGFSVQKHHIEKLPPLVRNRNGTKKYVIPDTIEGWSDAVGILVASYFNQDELFPEYVGKNVTFDYSEIRPAGAFLNSSGGKAPGPEPLKSALSNIRKILDRALKDLEFCDKSIRRLTSIQAYDIVMHSADAVISGGVRRSATICLFSPDDEEMAKAKTGSWFVDNPQRGRSNNSAVLMRHKVTKEFFMDLWKRVELSGAGEPGIYLNNDKDWGTNPCCEIALRPFQFCNLCEVNVSDVKDQEDFNNRVKAAAFIGTLQAAYTDFHYLREIWKETTEKDALIGVSMTGIGSAAVLQMDMKEAASIVTEENSRVSKLIGIKTSARCTTVKPAGTTSLVLGTSSGIHAWHNDYYVRRMRVGKNEAIYKYLSKSHPELIEDEYFRPHDTAVISVPQKAPAESILRTESPFDTLERVKRVAQEWIKPGHRRGSNTHNVSATISLKKNEWDKAGEWMWSNRDYYNGLSVLPYDGGTYTQAPFEDINESEYNKMSKVLSDIDLTRVIETDDNTDLSGELACAGGNCEIV